MHCSEDAVPHKRRGFRRRKLIPRMGTLIRPDDEQKPYREGVKSPSNGSGHVTDR
jgi:hypothetical protein